MSNRTADSGMMDSGADNKTCVPSIRWVCAGCGAMCPRQPIGLMTMHNDRCDICGRSPVVVTAASKYGYPSDGDAKRIRAERGYRKAETAADPKPDQHLDEPEHGGSD